MAQEFGLLMGLFVFDFSEIGDAAMSAAAQVDDGFFATTFLLLGNPINISHFETAIAHGNKEIVKAFLDSLPEENDQDWKEDLLIGPVQRGDLTMLRLLTKHPRFSVPLQTVKSALEEAKKLKRKMAINILKKYRKDRP